MAENEKVRNSDKTGKDDKFELKNKRIANQSRLEALEAIMINQKNELMEIKHSIQKFQSDIKYLESVFADPVGFKP